MSRRNYVPYVPLPPTLREQWEAAILPLIAVLLRDGCAYSSVEAIEAFGVICRHASKDMRQNEEAQRPPWAAMPRLTMPGVLGLPPSEEEHPNA